MCGGHKSCFAACFLQGIPSFRWGCIYLTYKLRNSLSIAITVFAYCVKLALFWCLLTCVRLTGVHNCALNCVCMTVAHACHAFYSISLLLLASQLGVFQSPTSSGAPQTALQPSSTLQPVQMGLLGSQRMQVSEHVKIKMCLVELRNHGFWRNPWWQVFLWSISVRYVEENSYLKYKKRMYSCKPTCYACMYAHVCTTM